MGHLQVREVLGTHFLDISSNICNPSCRDRKNKSLGKKAKANIYTTQVGEGAGAPEPVLSAVALILFE